MTYSVGGAVITRATLAYNRVEDRISLTCLLKDDKCTLLWLTSRLSSQLMPHLRRLDAQFPDASPISGHRKAARVSLLASEDLESYPDARSLENAEVSASKVPVVAEAGSASWVVTEIEITKRSMLVQLGFRGDGGHAPVYLSLGHTSLAQWLDGLRQCYVQAGWSMECWRVPASTGPQNDSVRQRVLH